MSKNGIMSKEKSRKRHITNFYMETLILVVVVIAVILVLTRVFAFSGNLSSRARILTQAVHLAENAAEAVAASESLDSLQELLEENGNVQVSREGEAGTLQFWYDEELQPAAAGGFRLEVTWMPETAGGSLAESTVSVYWMEEESPIYTLETAVWLGMPF